MVELAADGKAVLVEIPMHRGGEGILLLIEPEENLLTREAIPSLTHLATRVGNLLSTILILPTVEENRRHLETVLQTIGEGVFTLDGDGRLIFSNPTAERLLGLPSTRGAEGPRLDDLPLDGSMRDRLFNSLREKRELLEEVRLERSERVLQLETRLFTATGDGRGGLVAVIRDVTESKELERMREEFVSTLSHELRTPLTSIKAYAATLRRPDVTFDHDTQQDFLSVIETEADRLARLIHDLLDTSRAESGRLELRKKELDLSLLAEKVLEKIRAQAGTHHLRLTAHVRPVPVKADADRLEQVITNLLDNALKYSPAGSTVTLSVEKKEGVALLSVSDQGIGIPEDQHPFIFEKFHRVRDERSHHVQGTGLGLFLCRKIVEAHGGKIWVESGVGKGSIFRFSLPLIGGDELAAREDTQLVNLNG